MEEYYPIFDWICGAVTLSAPEEPLVRESKGACVSWLLGLVAKTLLRSTPFKGIDDKLPSKKRGGFDCSE